MSSTDPTDPEPRRFSIPLPRPLWIGLAVVVLVVVGVGVRIGVPLYREHAAIRMVEHLGGICYTESRFPYWLQDWVGDELLSNSVWRADLSDTEFADADVAYVNSFPGIRILYLANTPITDSGLARLGRLPDLSMLDLSGTRITDAGLQHMRNLPALAVLWIDHAEITDAGLQCAEEIPELESISLDHTKVTKAGIARLRRSRPGLEIDVGDWQPEGDDQLEGDSGFWIQDPFK